MVFMKVPGVMPDFDALDMSDARDRGLQRHRRHELTRARADRQADDLTEFDVTRILFQLVSARLIEPAPEEKSFRPVFLDVEDSPELLKVISTYNDMFGRLYDALQSAVGDERRATSS